jgi:hypothetical protein
MRGGDEEIFVHEAMCVEKAHEQFVDPGQEKGGCKCNPLQMGPVGFNGASA